MGRKIAGILSIIIGAFLALASIAQIGSVFNTITQVLSKNSGGYGLGFAFGQVIGWLLFALLSFFAIKYGLKWIKKPKAVN